MLLAGYYRVNYEEELWKRIINALNSEERDKIHKVNRANVIDDLFKLARADEIEFDLVFRAANYLANETDYIPWKAAFNSFDYINRRLMGRPEIYETFRVIIHIYGGL